MRLHQLVRSDRLVGQIRSMHNQGLTNRLIALQLDIHHTTVTRALRDPSQIKPTESDKAILDIACDKFGVDLSIVMGPGRIPLVCKCRRWIARELRKAGRTNYEIGAIMNGRSDRTVRAMFTPGQRRETKPAPLQTQTRQQEGILPCSEWVLYLG